MFFAYKSAIIQMPLIKLNPHQIPLGHQITGPSSNEVMHYSLTPAVPMRELVQIAYITHLCAQCIEVQKQTHATRSNDKLL